MRGIDFVAFLLLAAVPAFVLCDICSQQNGKSCSACVSVGSGTTCGFNRLNCQCMAGDQTGPYNWNGSYIGYQMWIGPGSTTTCTGIGYCGNFCDCKSCNNAPYSCSWCSDSGNVACALNGGSQIQYCSAPITSSQYCDGGMPSPSSGSSFDTTNYVYIMVAVSFACSLGYYGYRYYQRRKLEQDQQRLAAASVPVYIPPSSKGGAVDGAAGGGGGRANKPRGGGYGYGAADSNSRPSPSAPDYGNPQPPQYGGGGGGYVDGAPNNYNDHGVGGGGGGALVRAQQPAQQPQPQYQQQQSHNPYAVRHDTEISDAQYARALGIAPGMPQPPQQQAGAGFAQSPQQQFMGQPHSQPQFFQPQQQQHQQPQQQQPPAVSGGVYQPPPNYNPMQSQYDLAQAHLAAQTQQSPSATTSGYAQPMYGAPQQFQPNQPPQQQPLLQAQHSASSVPYAAPPSYNQ